MTASLRAALLLSVLAGAPAFAADGRKLSVAPDGDDAADGSERRPWRSLTKAMAEADAGDEVTVRKGAYEATSSEQWVPAFHPARGGAKERPIVFRAAAGEEVVLRNTTTRVGEAYPAPVLGAVHRDHVVFEGFTLAKGERAVLFECRGVELRRCSISGVRAPPGHPGNVDCVWIQGAEDCAVRACKLTDSRTTDPSHSNGAAIKLYSSTRTVVEDCVVEDCGSGVFEKEEGVGTVIRRNRVRGCTVGVRIGMQKGPTRDIDVSQNVVVDSEIAVYVPIVRQEGWGDVRVRRNTIVRAKVGVATYGVADLVVEDCVFSQVGVALQVNGNAGADPLPPRSEHNAFHPTAVFKTGVYGKDERSYPSLAAWRAATGNDKASLECDPGFVDATKGDFRLRKDSKLRGAGTGGGTVGAFAD